MVELNKLKSLAEWPKARKEIETALLDVLGYLPKERSELQVKASDEESFAGYVRRRVSYFVSDWERVSAWMFVPDGKDEVPALICCHSQVPQGKSESAGIQGDRALAFAEHYAARGFVTIAPDCITAGERVSHGLEPFDTKSFYADYPKCSVLGKMLWDHVHAVDALLDMPRVDPDRIGVVGHGLGATNALLLASLDERVQVCVASCGFTRFADDKDVERWARQSGLVLLPKLREAIEQKAFPFDWEHVLALAAPSPVLLLTALNDENLSGTKSCDAAVKAARSVYRLLGEPNALENWTHKDGHGLSGLALDVADEWFDRWI